MQLFFGIWELWWGAPLSIHEIGVLGTLDGLFQPHCIHRLNKDNDDDYEVMMMMKLC